MLSCYSYPTVLFRSFVPNRKISAHLVRPHLSVFFSVLCLRRTRSEQVKNNSDIEQLCYITDESISNTHFPHSKWLNNSLLWKYGFGINLGMNDGGVKRSAGCEWESITGFSVPEGELLFIASPCCVLVMSYPPTPSKQSSVLYSTPYVCIKKEKKKTSGSDSL